jgi:hypothetical protein
MRPTREELPVGMPDISLASMSHMGRKVVVEAADGGMDIDHCLAVGTPSRRICREHNRFYQQDMIMPFLAIRAHSLSSFLEFVIPARYPIKLHRTVT